MKLPRILTAPWRAVKNPLFLYQHHRQIHALRVALAFLFGLMINLSFPIQHGSWMLVTIVVMLGNVPHLGAVAQKTRQRTVGTTVGALAGLLALALYGVSPFFSFAWMVLVILLSAYHAIGKAGYTALTVGITLVIVAGVGDGTEDESLWRTANVALGSLISMLAASFFPQRALDHWRFLLSDNLRESALIYSHIARRVPLDTEAALGRFNTRLVAMRGLISAAASECEQSAVSFESIQRGQRTLYSLFDRMDDIAEKTAVLADGGRQRQSIVKALFRAAHGIRFLHADLLLNALPEPAPKERMPGACDWLSAELSQTTSRLCDELLLLMPAILAIQQPLLTLSKEKALRNLED
ncbi:MAG: FUSC family protein [Proteobacteria bacterium]|nr:FUSC family protein [Pseudomonadota bacterium]